MPGPRHIPNIQPALLPLLLLLLTLGGSEPRKQSSTETETGRETQRPQAGTEPPDMIAGLAGGEGGEEQAQAGGPPGGEAWPVQECIAILGGVLGFWGGVGSMGTLFLLVLMTQRFFCRRREDKKETW